MGGEGKHPPRREIFPWGLFPAQGNVALDSFINRLYLRRKTRAQETPHEGGQPPHRHVATSYLCASPEPGNALTKISSRKDVRSLETDIQLIEPTPVNLEEKKSRLAVYQALNMCVQSTPKGCASQILEDCEKKRKRLRFKWPVKTSTLKAEFPFLLLLGTSALETPKSPLFKNWDNLFRRETE